MTTDPDTQRELFHQAARALGGLRAAARYLEVNERTMRALVSGRYALHDGHLRDMAAALAAHAARCRELERKLTPAFAGNLTAHQLERQGKPDARRYDTKPKPLVDQMREALAHATANMRVPRRWEINQAASQELCEAAGVLAQPEKKLLGLPVALVQDDKFTPTFKLFVEERERG